jgi:hypothetical protein
MEGILIGDAVDDGVITGSMVEEGPGTGLPGDWQQRGQLSRGK